MSCITASFKQGVKAIRAEFGRLSTMMAEFLGCDVIRAEFGCDTLRDVSFECNRTRSVEFGFVCTRGDLKYLKVQPQRLYFHVGMWEDFVSVISNTTWVTKLN